ncbi:hypothetical protein LCGC14_1541350, partial [marine sediment metagenome]
MTYRICVARPAGHKLECPDMGTYLAQWINDLKNCSGASGVDFFTVSNPRIRMMRNMCVAHAFKKKADFLLFLDPDHRVDKYVQLDPQGKTRSTPDATPFFPAAWALALQHRQQNHPPAVYAGPYCGCPPHMPVQTFTKNKQGQLVRLGRDQAAGLRGWHQVTATGTGLMLIDMRVFERLRRPDVPFFKDTYVDPSEVKIKYSQDVDFCLRCGAAGMPIYLN